LLNYSQNFNILQRRLDKATLGNHTATPGVAQVRTPGYSEIIHTLFLAHLI